MRGDDEKEDSEQRRRQGGLRAATMRRRTMKMRKLEAALPTMTSGNEEEADVRGGSEKEDGCVDTRRITSRYDQEE